MFCKNCGRNIEDMKKCPYCNVINVDGAEENNEAKTDNEAFNKDNENIKNDYIPTEKQYVNQNGFEGKSRLTAGLLQLFLGGLGVGRFYLGYSWIGVLQILASVLTCGVGGTIWGVVDGILILCDKVKKDGYGNPLAN